jgi:hypothetical protein
MKAKEARLRADMSQKATFEKPSAPEELPNVIKTAHTPEPHVQIYGLSRYFY